IEKGEGMVQGNFSLALAQARQSAGRRSCVLASLTTLASILPSASNRFRGVVDTVPAFRADGRFSIAIATYQQISKKDRTQTADNVRSFDAYS
ncbi:MAG: hypothetical protein WCD83_14595, partial [Pseudolabrys sp.]